MSILPKRVTVVCGHYGVGKTNLSMNLAIECAREGDRVTLIDLDIVNPYFRSADYDAILKEHGIRVIGPNFANTNLDTPSLPPSIGTAIDEDAKVIIDVGGDDAGATALAVFADHLAKADVDVLYVINRYRSLTTEPEEAVAILRDIEAAAHIKADAIVNNSHLKQCTTAEIIEDSVGFAERVSELTGLPIRFTTVPAGIPVINNKKMMHQVDVLVRTPWE